jgi:hypothetical protein
MMTLDSHDTPQIRPEDLMDELGIKKDTYYRDLRYLEIEAQKDSDGKAYLTIEQANRVRSLRHHVEVAGERRSFKTSSLVKVDDSNLATSPDEIVTEDIYVQPENPVEQFDVEALMRSAAELKAREIAMPSLVKRALADGMSEDDLPDDLQEKIGLAREAANPKFTPASVAQTLLTQYRNNRSGKQGALV